SKWDSFDHEACDDATLRFMSNPQPITYWNRFKQRIETESIYGEGLVRWFYETRPGKTLSEVLLARPLVSRLYGATQDTRWSARKIPEFIRRFEIPMDEYEETPFRSFNEFFIRKFKPGRRPFAPDPTVLPAFAEARYYAFDSIQEEQQFPIKGKSL